MDRAADLVMLNGAFEKMDRSRPTARACAIKGGRFLDVGDDREIVAYATEKTIVLDLNERRVIPSLIDSHIHVIRWAQLQ